MGLKELRSGTASRLISTMGKPTSIARFPRLSWFVAGGAESEFAGGVMGWICVLMTWREI
jgi:hypothetical protein